MREPMNIYCASKAAISFLFFLSALIFFNACAGVENIRLPQDEKANLVSPTPNKQAQAADRDALFREAVGLGSAGKYEDAIRAMEKVIDIDPKDKIGLIWIAKWNSALERYPQEADVYLNLVKLDPNDASAHLSLAKLQIQKLDNCKDGVIEAKIAKSLFSKQMSYVLDKLIATGYECLGDRKNAIQHYRLYLQGSKAAGNGSEHKAILKRIEDLSQSSN